MAGHASNWFKTGGGAKGRVFISNGTLARQGLTKAAAAALDPDTLRALSRASGQPGGQAKTREDLTGTITIRTSAGDMQVRGEERGVLQVHRDPNSQGYVVAYQGQIIRTSPTLAAARRAADALNRENGDDIGRIASDREARERVMGTVRVLMAGGALETDARRRQREADESYDETVRADNARRRLGAQAKRTPAVKAAQAAYDAARKADDDLRTRQQREWEEIKRTRPDERAGAQREAELRAAINPLADAWGDLSSRRIRANVDLGLQPQWAARARERLEQGVYRRETHTQAVAAAEAGVRALRGTGDRTAQRAAREALTRAKAVLEQYDRLAPEGYIDRQRQEDEDLVSGARATALRQILAEVAKAEPAAEAAAREAERVWKEFRQQRFDADTAYRQRIADQDTRHRAEREAASQAVEQARRATSRALDEAVDALRRRNAPANPPPVAAVTPAAPVARSRGRKRS